MPKFLGGPSILKDLLQFLLVKTFIGALLVNEIGSPYDYDKHSKYRAC